VSLIEDISICPVQECLSCSWDVPA